MRSKILAASFAILFAHSIAAAAPAAAPLPMTPTGPWNVEFADSMCLLSRPFGKDGATTLILKPNMLGNGMEIIVTRGTTSIDRPEHGKAAVDIADKRVDFDTFFNAYSTAKARLIRVVIPDAKIELTALRGTLSIDAKAEGQHSFSIVGIERAFPVLATCVAQLRAIYKVRDADIGALTAKPEVQPNSLFTVNDYPGEALRKGQSGTVGVLVWVEADGRVSTCEIVDSTASSVLEQTTCNILKRRARWTPAKDAAGKSVRAPGFTRIRWVLP